MEKRMDERFTRVNEGIDSVLAVLVHVDERQKREQKNHEKRITVLENAMAV